MTAAVAATATAAPTAAVDSCCPLASAATVHGDYNAMLNQTNIQHNNNKFYIIQLLQKGGQYYVWCRWGRVGEVGQSSLKGPSVLSAAVSEFGKKFQDKTSNSWANRAKFQPKAGKYQLIEVEGEADAQTVARLAELDANRPKVEAPRPRPAASSSSALSPSLRSFLKLILDKDMFTTAMSDFEIDTRKMPLGQLSKRQVQRGFDVLVELQKALDASSGRSALAHLSSQFYTVIPHAFGRRAPPVIDTSEKLRIKLDMLNVLSDIELALSIQDDAGAPASADPQEESYAKLGCELTPVDPRSDEYKLIEGYLHATRQGSHDLVDVFRADRRGEAARFSAHDALDNRRLLWHGTNVAVIAAILSSGLRIMPHSGGRVGKGIYLASEQSKSAGYVGRAGRTGVMFLCEAALGKEHHITRDDSSLRAPPRGYDSIVARGHTEPDPAFDQVTTFDGRKVFVPHGKPVRQPKFANSSFTQSEYLLYQESQVRLRYVLRMHM